MITLLLASLFTVVSVAVIITLADNALRASNAFKALKHERALANAGFMPTVEAREVRLRPAAANYRGTSTRAFAQRLPRSTSPQSIDSSAA